MDPSIGDLADAVDMIDSHAPGPLQDRFESLSPNRIKQGNRSPRKVTNKKRQLEVMLQQPDVSPEHPPPPPRSSSSKRRQCHCKNSKCLKLYCECFAAGEFCDGCICIDCHNTPDNKEVVERAKNATLERNPAAFAPKVNSPKSEYGKHNKGCTCKKTGCLKRYCECFQARVFCSGNCRCVDCKNHHGNEERQALVDVNDYTARAPESSVTKKRAPTQAETQAIANVSESVKRVFRHITGTTVLNSLCEVLIRAANEPESTQTTPPTPRKEESNNNANESKEEEKSPNELDSEHVQMMQERAVLQNFAKFMKRTSGILQKTVEQYQTVPFSSSSRVSTPLSSNKNGSGP